MPKIPQKTPSQFDTTPASQNALLVAAEARILSQTLLAADVNRMAFGSGTDGIVVSAGTSNPLNIRGGYTATALQKIRVNAAGTDIEWYDGVDALAAGTGISLSSTTGTPTISISTVPVANGGTGLTTLTSKNLLVGEGTSNVSFISPSTANRLLKSNGTVWAPAQADLTTDVTGILPVPNGGTGLSGVNSGYAILGAGTAAFTAVAPTANRLLKGNGTTWAAAQADLTTDVTGVLPVVNGGTGRNNWTEGALVKATDTTTLSNLFGTDRQVCYWLGGFGSAFKTPDWNVSEGGTGLTTLTSKNLLVGEGTSNVSFISPSTADRLLKSNGTVWAPAQADLTTDVTGVLPVVNGGSGRATLNTNHLLLGQGTSQVGLIAPSSNTVLVSDGLGWSAGPVDLNSAMVTGALPAGNGGTGATTLTSKNLLVGEGTSAVSFVSPSTANRLLKSNGTVWAPAQADLTTDVTGVLPETNGGTGQSSYTTGDILYASASNTLSKLAAGTNGHVLTLAAGIPSWAAGGGGGVTPAAVTAGSSKITLGGTPATAALQAFSIDVAEANLTLGNLGGTLGVTKGGTGLTTCATGDIIYGSASNTLSKLAAGTNGYVLTLAAGIPSWAAAAGMSVNFQNFTSSGTWTKPSGAKYVRVICIGGGGGGGSGRRGLASSTRLAGWGGNSGTVSDCWYDAAQLSSSETITVGAGGTGGAAQTTNSTDGNNGGTGGDTFFGGSTESNAKQVAYGGGGGNRGDASGGGSAPTIPSMIPGTSATGGPSRVGASGYDGGRHWFGPGGGGGGSGISSTNQAASSGFYGGRGGHSDGSRVCRTVAAGSNGGAVGGSGGSPAAGGAGVSASPTTSSTIFGSGGGGASSLSGGTTSYAGGAGGQPGGGGGGGSASTNGTNSGAGGAGGAGGVILITYK